MNQEQILQDVLPFVGGASNISRQVWQKNVLHLAVKDVGVLQLEALRGFDIVAGVELNRSRVSITMQGSEKEEETEMAKNKFDELADQIIGLVGGKDNFTKFFHCVTRLRFVVNDKSKVDEAAIKNIPGVVGTKWADNQIQIIIGTDVETAFNAICQKNGISDTSAAEAAPDQASAKKKITPMTVLEAVTGCIIPVIPAFMGCALVRTIGVLLGMLGIISTDSTTYQFFEIVNEGSNYFIPILVAYTAAKKFGATETLAMALCGMLLAPTFVGNVTNGTAMTLFGLPIYAGSYSGMLFPSIIIVFVMSYVEKFFKKHIHFLEIMLIPVCVTVVMVPLEFALLAPVGSWIGTLITNAIMFAYTKLGFIAVGLMTALFPLMVLAGMHTAMVPAMMTCYMTYGFDPMILPSMSISNFNEGAAALGVMLKSKNKNTRATALGAAIPAIVAGVTEPALFGLNLPHKTPLIAVIIGGFVGGCYLGLQGIGCYGAGGVGIMSVLGFISSEPRTLIHGLIGTVISVVVTFVLTLILYKGDKKEAA